MQEKNPFEGFLAKMIELMDLIQKHQGPINIPLEAAQELERLTEDINTLEENMHQLLAELGTDPKMLKILTMQSSQISDKDKRLFEQAKMAGRDAKALKTSLEKVSVSRKSRESPNKMNKEDEKRKQEMKERRKLFKSIGGDKNWIPL